MPTVSIVMPCYNAEPFVAASVSAILCQTFADFELLIVDDFSKDQSVIILRELADQDPRIKLLLHDSNLGASRSRNDGLRLAIGDYVGFCDADDIWKSEKLQKQIELLSANPSFDITYCDSEIIDEAGQPTGKLFSDNFPLPTVSTGNIFEQLCFTNFINMQTVLVRRAALSERIFFDESIKWVEDWWQWLRLSFNHRFIYDPHVMAQYRVHQSSTRFTQKPGICRNRWKVCRRNLVAHPNMGPHLQALMWYQMGFELSLLGRRRASRHFFGRALAASLKTRIPFSTQLKMSARFLLSYLPIRRRIV